MKLSPLLWLALPAVCLLPLRAQGESLMVPNYSFEAVTLGDGASSNTIANWSQVVVGPNIATVNPVDAQFGGATGDTIPLPGTGDGLQCANFNLNSQTGPAGSGRIQSARFGIVQPSEIYLLTLAVGIPLDQNVGFAGVFALSLNGQANSSTFAVNLADVPVGTFSDFNVSYTPAAIDIGKPLSVSLRSSLVMGSPNVVVAFDNVRVTSVVIPEANTFTLVLVGSALFFVSARVAQRRRMVQDLG